jgi:surface protein
MEDPEKPISNEELTESLGLNKGQTKFNKKILLIGGISIGVLLLLIIIIIIIVNVSSDDDNNEKKPLNKIGEINCIYDVQTATQNTKILGNDFKKHEINITIDGENIGYSKEYKFKSMGEHNVTFNLYENLNMDYMFKDVKDLISVEMNSDKNCKITSMISTFENCENLNKFSITGFDTRNLKSMKKFFYNSNINTFNFTSLNTDNLEDISYMFAKTNFINFSFNGLKTNSVTNMSHLFEECSSLQSIDFTEINTNNVKDISYMFSYCTAISSIDFNTFNTSQVIDMSNLFQQCFS